MNEIVIQLILCLIFQLFFVFNLANFPFKQCHLLAN